MRSCFISLFLLASAFLFAQQWNWAVSAGGGGNTDFCFGIATDSQANAYWVGSVSGTVNFGCATLTPNNTIAGVVAKYDESGVCQWARGITTGFYDAWVYGIAIDAQDRIYVTGSCQGNADFGNGIILSGSGSSDDWFTARYDVDGNCIWAKRIGNSTSTSEGRGIAVDAQGDIYASGFANGSGYTFDPITVSTGGFTRQAVIVKYDSTGTALWARTTTGFGTVKSARSIAVAGDRLFVTGQVGYTQAFYDGIPITPEANALSMYVLACDLQGNGLWARSYGNGDHEGFGIAADTLGNVFVAGRMWGSLSLPDDTLTSNGSNDDMLLMGFDRNGNYRWGKSTGSPQRDVAWGVTADGMGNAYVAAHFNNTIDFFGASVTSLGGEDVLIAKVEADGDVVWRSRPSGYQRDIPLCIHRQAAAPHKLYFGGYYWGAITYGSTTIDDVGNGDAMMVSGMDSTFHVNVHTTQVCPGSCNGDAIAFTNGTAPFTYSWSDGSIAEAINSLCAGEYVVEVSDANGQVRTETVHIEEQSDPGYTLQVQNDSLWIAGGESYTWFFNGTTAISGDSASHVAELTGNYHAVVADANGCFWNSDTVLVVLNTGLVPMASSAVRIVPNPAIDVVHVRTDRRVVSIVAWDVSGRITTVPMIGPQTFSVADLASGIWLLELRTDDGDTTMTRLVKQ